LHLRPHPQSQHLLALAGTIVKTVGHRQLPRIHAEPSGRLLAEAARVNDALRGFPNGGAGFIPKGVYRFMTHEDANRHWEDCLAAAMARLARSRMGRE
jgi:hypothetical protein